MVVKLRKGQKILKDFENNSKFQQNLAKIQDVIILRTISSQEIIQYFFFKPEIVSLVQRSMHLEQKFSKNWKIWYFIRKLLKLKS